MRAHHVKTWLMPFIGMSFFWTYFRYQAFFGILYPSRSTLSWNDVSVPAYTLFLVVLLVLSVALIPSAKAIERTFSARRGPVCLCSVAGSLGAGLAIMADRGILGPVALGISAPFVVLGFLAGYLAWALYFSRSFGMKYIVLLAASFLTSLLLFPALGFLEGIRVLLAIATPAAVGLAWYLSPAQSNSPAKTHRSSLREITPYLGLFIMFLLAGSIVRGITDTLYSESDVLGFRWIASLGVAFAILVGCWCFYRRKIPPGRDGHLLDKLDEYHATENMTLVFWIGLAILFLAGMFLGLFSGTYSVGGHIVVITRSTLDFFLWVLLCNVAFHKKAAPLPLFIVCGVLIEVISWFLSYSIVPHLMSLDTGASMPASDFLVLSTVFALIALVIVVLGAIALRRQPERLPTAAPPSHSTDLGIPLDKIGEFKLTAREVEVVRLFAQGHSMKKVASLLFISTSTAQSHIKSGYRKLGVHSKDELIELIARWNA